MAEAFFKLSLADRREVLYLAAARSGRAVHLLERDVWVVLALNVLFEAPFAKALVFKGGTSLSKAYGVIGRFSEDVDLTYSIRAIAPDLVADIGDAVPSTRSQEERWSKTIRTRLRAWLADTVAPLLADHLAVTCPSARARAEGEKVLLEYDPLSSGSGYVRPVVVLEFGARATGEPFEQRAIVCDSATHIPEVIVPEATSNVMRPERTFWEKATAIHVFCRGGRFRTAERFSRHWYDTVCLDEAGHVDAALKDRSLANHVAHHESMFFREKDAAGRLVDYHAAVNGDLQLVPDREEAERLAADYCGMVSDGLLFDPPPAFETLLARCDEIQRHANR